MAPDLFRAPVLGAALLLTVACASSGPYWSREDQGAAEATELRERVTRLESQLAAAESRNAELQRRADGLEREVDRLRQSAAALSDAPPPLTGAEVLPTAGLPAPRGGTAIEQSDLDIQDETSAAPAAAFTAGAGEPPTGGGEDAQTLYEHSLALLEQGRTPEAEDGFLRFLAANAESDLADNAQFWLAEAALRRADVPAALAGFRAVVENYPEGNKIPDALLKVGSCLATLGETASAETVYRELLARFPATAAAETARQRLARP